MTKSLHKTVPTQLSLLVCFPSESD